MTGWWRPGLLIAGKNLAIDRHTGEALLVTAPFGAVGLWITPMAVGTDLPLLRQVGPGMFWVVVLLFGSLVALRNSAVDTPAQDGMLTLAGVPGAVRLLGTATASFVLLVGFELALLPVAVALFDPPWHGWAWMLVMLPVVALGLALLGTVAHSLLQSEAQRMTLGPLLTVPLSVPLLLGATQTSEAVALGRSPTPWLLLSVVVDLVLFLALLFVGHVLDGDR